MQTRITIARSYAIAVFNIAVEKKSLKYWKNFLKILLNISKNNLINKFFCEIYSDKTILKVIIFLFKKNIHQYGKNFVKLLIINKRLNLIQDIFNIFMILYNQYNNIIHIYIISSVDIEKKKKKIFLNLLEKKINKKINITFKVNSVILHGVILKYLNKIIDNCVLSRYKALSNFLLS